jgi:hypothetical protein
MSAQLQGLGQKTHLEEVREQVSKQFGHRETQENPLAPPESHRGRRRVRMKVEWSWKYLNAFSGHLGSAVASASPRWCKNCSNKLQHFDFVVKRKFQNPSGCF